MPGPAVSSANAERLLRPRSRPPTVTTSYAPFRRLAHAWIGSSGCKRTMPHGPNGGHCHERRQSHFVLRAIGKRFRKDRTAGCEKVVGIRFALDSSLEGVPVAKGDGSRVRT
jgi:hypothetical protein